jgi:hypothetical protein
MTIEEAVEQIINVIDGKMLLGAAYDCMTEAQQDRFKDNLKEILEEI